MDVVRNLLMGVGCLGLLWLGSCTIMGVGSVVALDAATRPENVERVDRERAERETARHNEEMNDEAGYEADYRDRSSSE